MFAGEILIWLGAASGISSIRLAIMPTTTPRLNSFAKMRVALLANDFQAAAREALDSKWATQTSQRSTEIASLIGGDLSALQNADLDHLES